ncbi:MAG: Gfo/Idh/MocA family protein [Candidatus Puniceispirillaceae bacterium]
MAQLLVMGSGLIGRRHISAIQQSDFCHLAGVIEPDDSRHDDNTIRYFKDLDDVDVPADGVIIATPTGLHFENAKQAASRGLHMLIEKPVTATPDEADRLTALLAPTNLHCLVGHHRRYHPSVQQLRQWVKDGEIGDVITSSLIWAMRKPDAYFADNWRASDGSPVMINLIHDIDLLRFVMGEIIDITGFASSHHRQALRVESGAVAMRFASGACATISFADSALSPWGFEAGTNENPHIGATFQDMWWLTGTSGSISFPSLTRWCGADDWSQPVKATSFDVDKTVPLDAQLSHFVDVINGKTEPMITVGDAAESLRATYQLQALLAAQLNDA